MSFDVSLGAPSCHGKKLELGPASFENINGRKSVFLTAAGYIVEGQRYASETGSIPRERIGGDRHRVYGLIAAGIAVAIISVVQGVGSNLKKRSGRSQAPCNRPPQLRPNPFPFPC
jgi:hypothetical protein